MSENVDSRIKRRILDTAAWNSSNLAWGRDRITQLYPTSRLILLLWIISIIYIIDNVSWYGYHGDTIRTLSASSEPSCNSPLIIILHNVPINRNVPSSFVIVLPWSQSPQSRIRWKRIDKYHFSPLLAEISFSIHAGDIIILRMIHKRDVHW